MKLPQYKNKEWNYLALAFAIPTLCFLGIMVLGLYEPFGNNRSMLYSDMYHQYYPFFLAFRQALRSGESLLYTWSVGMGLDYLGLISYYLASPLNLLTVVLPESWMLEYFSLLVPIKLGLASLFFAVFLKDLFRKDDLSISLFGGFYGLCAWALGYQWNIMWLDTFALLPLVALGTVRLLRDKRFFLYTLTLFLSVWSNYYIGFFTCIFVLLTAICHEICRYKGFGRLVGNLFRIGVFSILAIGMTAVLELPALAALQTTQSSVNAFPQGFRLNIADENTWKGLLDAMRQVAGNFGGGLEPTFKEGLPNLYCGVAMVPLALLFLMSDKVLLRDKICSVLLTLFFMVSFIIRQLDYIWHGFHFTNMIPYRFSFLASFVLLYMAYRAWLLRRHYRPWQFILAGILSLGIFACSDSRTEPLFIAYNLTFLAAYIGIFLYPALLKRLPREADPQEKLAQKEEKRKRRELSGWLMAGVLMVELILNTVNFGVFFPYTGVSNYPKGTGDAEAVVEKMEQLEAGNLFYRAETTHSQTLNDGALNGYNGISTFTSSANVQVTKFMQALGYGAKNTYNRYCYEEASPVSNLFLGVKYMIERDGIHKEHGFFDEVFTSGNVILLENNAYLPLGFLANVQLSNVNFSKKTDNYTFQNDLLTAASGVTAKVFNRLGKESVTITGDSVTVSKQTSAGYCAYQTEGTSGSITYTVSPLDSGLLCIDLNLPKRNSFTVTLNGQKLYSETYSLPQLLSVGYVEPGDKVEIKLTCKEGENSNMTVSCALVDEEVFRQAYEVLAASTLEVTGFSTTLVEGTISCDRDGLLYTSIPQNGCWQVTVDGKEADIVLIGDAMIGVPLSEGSHALVFSYHNQAFSFGWKVSLLCAIILLALTAIAYKPKRKKGKYER